MHRRAVLRRIVTSRWTLLVVAALVGLAVTGFMRERMASNAIEQRLIGKWSFPTYVAKDTVERWIMDFRPDRTLRYHPRGEPQPETGRIGDYWRWHVANGDLVIIYQTRISPDASPLRRVEQVGRAIRDQIKGEEFPLVYADRFAIDEVGNDTITLTCRPGGSPNLRPFKMKRMSASAE